MQKTQGAKALNRRVSTIINNAPHNGGISYRRSISRENLGSLRQARDREEASSLTIFLAAFSILIHRYTRGECAPSIDVSIVPREGDAGIRRADLLPRYYRVDLSLTDDMSLGESIREADASLFSAVPPEAMPGLLALSPQDALASFKWSESGDTGRSISLMLSYSGQVVADLEYESPGDSDPIALRVADHWEAVLTSFRSNPETPISRLPIMHEEERTKILREWKGSPHDPDIARPERLPDFFESTSDRFFSRTALLCEGVSMTYGELDARANSMAHYLRSLGVTRGSKVGIFLPRSMDVYVAILGVLKAGATYVPIDPEYPADRVDYILNDCRVAALISTTSLSAGLSRSEYSLVNLDTDCAAIASEPRERLELIDASSEDLAYIIYTSGSTGRPKGVQIEHKSACNLVRSESKVFHISPEDRVFQGFSVAFDASVEEIWLAFFSGATLVVGTHEAVHSGPGLARILDQQRVTVLSCVPTLISMVEDDIPTLRLLILGGEQCPKDLVARWARNGLRVVNTYGPTEATVVATYDDCIPGAPITIGRPIPNYFTYVVDADLQPVPAGVPGELLLGGIGLSRGYANRADLTAEKFIPNPFSSEDPDAPHRLYRTGDLVSFNSRGQIEYLGRIDAQVKLRGFRIELSEIESVLMTCPGVQSAVVSVREDIPGVQQLIAYVISQQEASFDEAQVRSVMRERLPAYMMPSRFVTVTEFPTLPSGKVDRKRLPEPKEQAEVETKRIKQARTETEKELAKVWGKLFQPQRISIDDDFFELGGHSLLAARLVSELRKNHRMGGVSMLDVYKHPVLQHLAAKIDESAASDVPEHTAEEIRSEFHTASRLSYYFCTAIQALGVYISLGLFMCPWLISYWVYSRLSHMHYGTPASLLGAVSTSFAILPIMALIPVATKWLVIGRYKAGDYPLWGSYYCRFWFVRRIQSLVPLTYLRGTPLITLYCRLLGAKIGSNVYMGTHYIQVTDLLTIGDDTSIGMDVQIPGYVVEGGMLHIGSVSIGERCFIGTKSVLHADTTVEDEGMLDEFSMLPARTILPKQELWAGSPASFQKRTSPAQEPLHPSSRTAAFLYGLAYLASISVLLPAIPMTAGLLPGFWILSINGSHGSLITAAAFPIATAMFTILLCMSAVLIKRIVLPRIVEGEYRIHSFLHVRKWFIDAVMQMCLELVHPLYATLYLPPWFRMLGAKLGRRVEISTVAHITPDLLSIGAESFIADSACIGPTKVHLGRMTVEMTEIGSRTFVGNSALIPAGSALGNGYLIGVMSMPPSAEVLSDNPGSSWLGSPSVLLPRRQESAAFPESVIFNPPWHLYLLRGTIEFLRVTVPSSLSLLTAGLFVHISTMLYRATALPVLALLFPVIYMLSSCLTLGIAIAIKWAVMGRYGKCTRPLWSSFVWRTEMVTAIHECFAVPAVLNALQGTPFIVPYFRLMGAKIGKRVFMETTQITEFDLVHIGDDAALNSTCTIQTHLFEDRVMKTSDLYIGDKCCLGPMAVALYDSEIQEGTSLDGLSLLMKGENLPPWTQWEGIPARRKSRFAKVEEQNAPSKEPCPTSR